MEKINIVSTEMKKELKEGLKIWTIKFLHVGIEEKVGECFSKTEPVTGEQEAESVTYNSQYNRWDVKLAKVSSGNKSSGFSGKNSMTPEERKTEREQISRNSGLNYAVQLLATHPQVKEQMKESSVSETLFALAKAMSNFILTGDVPPKKQ